MTASAFKASDVLELFGEETGGGNPLSSFWHTSRAGLDGVSIIRRSGEGRARMTQIEAADLPRLALEAETAMRRYIAEAHERRGGRAEREPSVRRGRDFRGLALRAVAALFGRMRAMGVEASDVYRTIRRTTPFTVLEVLRAVPAQPGAVA